MAYKDPLDERARESRRKHYQNNREQYYTRNKVKQEQIKKYIANYKNRPCMDCGNSYPSYVMDLDHRSGEIKICNPAHLYKYGSWSKVEAELAKCDVVCANCHRKRTYIRAAVGKPGSLQNSCQIGFDS